jgi:hypothetical protein
MDIAHQLGFRQFISSKYLQIATCVAVDMLDDRGQFAIDWLLSKLENLG